MRERKIINLLNNEKIWIIETIIFALILFFILGNNISKICTIWEIEDESGYLFNASLFSNNDWRETFSNARGYYGFGYSLLLIPLFYICSSGELLIRGCIVINILCLLGIYFIQISMMKNMFSHINNIVYPVVSFLVCLYPYLVSNTLKVTCEVFLTLQYWIVIRGLYTVLKKKRYIDFFMLSISSIFIFFIHTRAIVVTFSAIMAIIIMTFAGKIEVKKTFFLLISAGGIFVFLYIIKSNILSFLGTGIIIETASEGGVNNVITLQYVLDRIKWLVMRENVLKYIVCAIAKLFYMAVSTAGMFILGIIHIWKEMRHEIKSVVDDYVKIVKIFCLISFMLMWIACIISGTGSSYNYMIYGRYYEYCAMPIILIGIMSLLSGVENKDLMLETSTIIGMGIITQSLSRYVENNQIGIDTNRIVGISYAIEKNENYTNVIYWIILYTVFCSVIYISVQKGRGYLKGLILSIFMITMLMNNNVVTDSIVKVNKNCMSDMEVANYILANEDEKEIYFLYETYRYDSFYQRMQVFIKEYPMHIIFPEDIDELNENIFLVTYINSETAQVLKENKGWKHQMSSKHYELFER